MEKLLGWAQNKAGAAKPGGVECPLSVTKEPINNKSSLKIHTEQRGSEKAAESSLFLSPRLCLTRYARGTPMPRALFFAVMLAFVFSIN